MAIYEFTTGYRGINKTKRGGQSEFEPFYNFKKGDLVDAEPYMPDNVGGITYSKDMLIVAGTFIVPAANLRQLQGQELKDAMAQLGLSQPEEDETTTGMDNPIKVGDLPADQQALFDKKASSVMSSKSVNIGKGAMIGGVIGLGAGYFMKKSLFFSTVIGIFVGAAVVGVYSAIKNKNANSTLADTSGQPNVTDDEANQPLPTT